jgi:hypothetical protein
MHHVVNYTITGERSKESIAELMSLVTERGTSDSMVAHWVYADGGGGFFIVDGSEMEKLYEAALAYGAWLEYSATPIMTIDEATSHITAWLEG